MKASRRRALLREVDALEPRLRQTVWPPMTYMMIPSILKAADGLFKRLTAWPPGDEEVDAALQKLKQLRADFHRER